MKKNLFFLISGAVAGIALCLTTAMLIPLDSEWQFRDSWDR